MPMMRVEIKLNDVVRFGRVTFKVTELVISEKEIKHAQQTLDQLQNGMFQVQTNVI